METSLNNTIPGERATVAELAVSYPGALSVFMKYNIDFCCGGHRSIDDACTRIGLDPEKIKQEIFSSVATESGVAVRPEKWTSAFLIDYIIQNHHTYVREALPELFHFLAENLLVAIGIDLVEQSALEPFPAHRLGPVEIPVAVDIELVESSQGERY